MAKKKPKSCICWRCGRAIGPDESYQLLIVDGYREPVCTDDRRCRIKPSRQRQLDAIQKRKRDEKK